MSKKSHSYIELDRVRVCIPCYYPVVPVLPSKGGQPACPICEGKNLRHLNPESVDGGEELLSVLQCGGCGAPLWSDTVVCQVCFFDPGEGDDFSFEDFSSDCEVR